MSTKQSGRVAGFQTLNEFISEESARDPEFAKKFEESKAREIKKRLGRPPKGDTKRGSREMRFDAPQATAEKIRKAAAADGRSVSSWLLQAAKKALAEA